MCYAPVHLKKTPKTMFKQKEFRMLKVPCGKCLECKMRRVKSWYVRLLAEKEVSESAHFITITYDDEYLPYSENGLMTLRYSDFQKFMKRLRKKHNGKPIKYYAVGEYGSNRHRPHYHAIIFNADCDDIVNSWHTGFVHIGKVTNASIYYTLKYISKAPTQSNEPDEDDDRTKEKSLMSKGLGQSYLTKEKVKYHKKDVTRPVTLLGGEVVALPRYYRDKIFTEEEKIKRSVLFNDYIGEELERRQDPLYIQRIKQKIRQHKIKILKTD